jgi:hypothetical protein
VSSTTAPGTFSELYTDLQNRVRDTTGVTATETIAKRYINIGLIDMHLGVAEKLPWAERSAVLITQPQYTTGTVSISQGSVTLTGTSTLWTTTNAWSIANARAGGKFVINGTPEVYEVSSVGGAGTITLVSRYVGSDVTAGSYIYFEDEYALAADFLRPLDWQRFASGSMDIPLLPRSEFRRRYPSNRIPGRPMVATINDKAPSGNTTPIRKVRFHRPPDSAYMIPYNYITKYLVVSSAGAAQESFSATTDEPIVPLRNRQGIVLHALYNWYRDRKDDVRSQEVKNEYVDFMSRTVGDQESGANHPQIRPRLSTYKARSRRPWTGGTGRYDTNGRFDRFED